MSTSASMTGLRERVALYWNVRTEQERAFLGAGAAILLATLVYVILIAPAVSGRATQGRALPELRQQAAQMQAMAQEAAQLAGQRVSATMPMTRESLTASLTARSITPLSLTMTGDYAKLDLKDVPFAGLLAWLDVQRREQRILVLEATLSAQTNAGLVDAQLTLRQRGATAP